MLDEFIPLIPVHFFAFQMDCLYSKGDLGKKNLLPDLSSFHGDFSFAEVYLGWNEKGIVCEVHVPSPFDEPEFPHIQMGDSVELFFDTRDVKTTAYTTRFCHHFYFLPEAIESDEELIQGGEMTRFRTEDIHELADASKLVILSEKKRKHRILKVFIPRECLHGYDPAQFDRLGFTYRINRKDGAKQYFSANERDFTIENQPSLWASLNLIKERS